MSTLAITKAKLIIGVAVIAVGLTLGSAIGLAKSADQPVATSGSQSTAFSGICGPVAEEVIL